MTSCNNLYLLSTIAYKLADCMSEEELTALSADLVVLGDMLANIIAQNIRCQKQNAKEQSKKGHTFYKKQ